jgi:quinol monooxygenase YgiN
MVVAPLPHVDLPWCLAVGVIPRLTARKTPILAASLACPPELTLAGDPTTMMTTGTFRESLMILINIKMEIRPEKMDEWLALADSYARDVNSEDGCLFFQFSRSLTNDNEFVCIEGFKDAEAGAAHVKQPYVTKFFDSAPDLVATQPQIIYIDSPHDGFGPMGEIRPR